METLAIVYISAEVVVGLLSASGNALVLIVILKTEKLHTITNVFVGNLAAADIVVGLLVAPCAALSFLGLPTNFYGCVFVNCLILMFTNISILMLLAVAFERFLAIKEPFLYQRLITVPRAIYLNIGVWILGCILGLVPMYGWHRPHRSLSRCSFTDIIGYEYLVYFQFFGLVLLPLFIMLCIYIYILQIVRKHTQQTAALQNKFNRGTAQDGFSKDVKAAKMFALVILLFGIFWLPVNIFNCVSLFCGPKCPFPYEGLLVAIVMSHANSCINPFLYATSNSRIKFALKRLFGFSSRSSDERTSNDYHSGHSRATKNNTVVPITTEASELESVKSTKDTSLPTNVFLVTDTPVGDASHGQQNNLHNHHEHQRQDVAPQVTTDNDIQIVDIEKEQLPISHPENSCSSTPLSIPEKLKEQESPVTHNIPNNHGDCLDHSNDNQSGTNARSTIPDSTPLLNIPYDNEIHYLDNASHFTVLNIKGESEKLTNEGSTNKSSLDKYINSGSQAVTEEVQCDSAHDNDELDLNYQRSITRKQHTENEFQKTSTSPESNIQNLASTFPGFVCPDTPLHQLKDDENSLNKNQKSTESFTNDTNINSNNITKTVTFSDDISKQISLSEVMN